MAQPIIELDHVTVRYNLSRQKNRGLKEYMKAMARRELKFQEFIAVNDVSLAIQPGESWGFIGTNGAGKSTLLKTITGILRPYKGTVRVSGSVAPLLELGAGFDQELTGRENIMMNGLILGMSVKEIYSRFDEIVDFSELENFLDVPVKNYSSGMKSRLGFSIATSARADILIADEVLSTGDTAFQAKCEARMSELLEGGTTLLFVSHNMNSVQNLCEKTLWLEHGIYQASGPTEEMLAAYADYLERMARDEDLYLSEDEEDEADDTGEDGLSDEELASFIPEEYAAEQPLSAIQPQDKTGISGGTADHASAEPGEEAKV